MDCNASVSKFCICSLRSRPWKVVSESGWCMCSVPSILSDISWHNSSYFGRLLTVMSNVPELKRDLKRAVSLAGWIPLPGICRHEAMISSDIWVVSFVGSVRVEIVLDVAEGEKRIDAGCKLNTELFNNFEMDDCLDFCPFCLRVSTIYCQPHY